MRVCRGSLILHRDGTPVCCSEELAGGFCDELSYERHRIFRSCGLTFRERCPECVRSEEPTGVGGQRGLPPGHHGLAGTPWQGLGIEGRGEGRGCMTMTVSWG